MHNVPGFTEWLTNILQLSTPILLAAMGALVTQRAGIWNIGVEGFMLVGAFAGAVTSYYAENAWAGVVAAMAAGAALSLVMAFIVIALRVDQFVTGLALNALAFGLTTYLLITIFHQEQSLVSDRIHALPLVDMIGLGSIPGIGASLAAQTPIVYFGWLSVLGVGLMLGRTGLGLRIRAAGDAPEAAHAAGISVARTRYIAFMISGMLAGLGGAQLSIGYLSVFSTGMTQGRGIIAFAAVIFGGAATGFVALAALLFGFAEEVSVVLSGSGIPPQIEQMAPYLLAIVGVTAASIVAGHARPGSTMRRFGNWRWRGRGVEEEEGLLSEAVVPDSIGEGS
jgi:simple sugar transport system permease protein